MIYGFDWDGTLVKNWTAEPLPGVRERLRALPADTRTFIATNQAGPVFRAVLGDAKYPTCEDVGRRISDGLQALGWRPDLLLIAVHSGKNGDAWLQAELKIATDFNRLIGLQTWFGPMRFATSPDPYQRKPAPGMLIRAAAHSGALVTDMCYIGDMESDEQAALAAGVRFQWADAWLMRVQSPRPKPK